MTLELRNLEKRFASVAAVDKVSLTIQSGEFFSLLGPSGCGKTTLLRVIAGILEPDNGSVILNGNDITKKPMHGRDIALVFQNYALFPHMTVFENVAFGLVMRRMGKQEIREKVQHALELVRMPGYADRYPIQISGGQQQRVAVARALVVRPAVLLLDEPLSNLDAKLREEMRTELKDIQREVGITTVLVTHDIHEAFAMSDRLALLNSGRVEQIGTASEIYQEPRTRFVAEFAGQSNHFSGVVKSVEGSRARVRLDDGIELWVDMGPRQLGAGDGVSLMMRPEKVRLNGSAGGANRFEAFVEEVVYLGGMTSYHLRLGQRRILAHVQNQDAPQHGKGEAISIAWNEHDCVALPNG